jgi:hypothetical protein
LKKFSGVVVEVAALVRTEQVCLAVRDGRVEVKDWNIERGEVASELLRVEWLMDGVAGQCVGELEVEEFLGRQGGTGAAEGDPRRGVAAQRTPRI